MAFSEALSKHKIFSRLYVNLVRAGETSGGLDLILDRLASFLEKELELRGKIRSAMTYPVIVFVFAVGVAYFLLTGIVPQFAQILTDLGSELPLLTRFLIAVSDLLRAATLPLLLLAVALFFAYRWYYGTPRGVGSLTALSSASPSSATSTARPPWPASPAPWPSFSPAG